jgi:hypothetical protein
MDQRVQLEDVRRVVVRTLSEMGAEEVDESLVRETTLYSDHAQPGRRFQYDDLRAVWFPDREMVEFFSADGEFLRTVAIPQNPLAAQAAA